MKTRSAGGVRPPDRGPGGTLLARFFLTELFANAIGAPVAAAYGGFMIEFSSLSPGRFITTVLVVMLGSQLLLALPVNLYLGRRIAGALALMRSGSLDGEGRSSTYRFLSTVALVQGILIFARMAICAAVVLLAVGAEFRSGLHFSAVLVFGLYVAYVTGILDYYFLQKAASGACEELVAGLPPDHPLFRKAGKGDLAVVFSNLRLVAPTVITSLGIFFMLAAADRDPASLPFFMPRIGAALALNILTLVPLNLFSQRYHAKRLRAVRRALEDMADHGDILRDIPTDLSDDYALTAFRINRSFALFRQVLSQLESAGGKISEAVMNFSSQIRQTVAATTQQASAVKEMVGTMEGSSQINRRIQERSHAMSGTARESQASVNEGFGKVQDTILKMDEIKNANVQTLAEIGDLTEEISSIGEIIEIINGIANQTRIIAFNAELEASSAGAAGTSFRIVAEEIRRLANGTVDSLVGIKGRINQIQQGSERLLATSEEGTVKIQEGMRLSGDLNDIFMSIRLSAESTASAADGITGILLEQSQAFDQVFSTLKQISEGAEQVLSGTRASGAEVGRLQGLVDELKQVLTRFVYREGGEGGPGRDAAAGDGEA